MKDTLQILFGLLGNGVREDPTAALRLAVKEVMHCGELVERILEDVAEGVRTENPKLLERVRNQAGTVRRLSEKISDSMAKLLSAGFLTESQANETVQLLYILGDIDRIALFSGDLCDSIQDKTDRKLRFPREAMEELEWSLQIIRKMYSGTIRMMKSGRREIPRKISGQKGKILELDFRMQRSHRSRVAPGKCPMELAVPFSLILYSIDRIGNSCMDLAEKVSDWMDLKSVVFDDSEEEKIYC